MAYAFPSPGGPRREATYWRPSAHQPHEKGSPLDRFFDRSDLPLYKDKPHAHGRSGNALPVWKRRPVQILFVLILLGIYWITNQPTPKGSGRGNTSVKPGDLRAMMRHAESHANWDVRRECVREAFRVSWDSYERNGWGMDEYRPLSKSGHQSTPSGVGQTIIEALDTLIIMNLTSRLSHARTWITTSLNFTQDAEVNTFDSATQLLGGLLSAHHLATAYPEWATIEGGDEDLYIEKATDLADRLIGAFTSDSGVPYTNVNLQKRQGVPLKANDGATSTAEAAGAALEWKYLATLLGEHLYWDAAEKAVQTVDDNGIEDGLVPVSIYPETGMFRQYNIRLGSHGGAYYEALLKQYLQTAKEEPVYLELWDQALAGIRKHLLTYSKEAHLNVLAERPDGLHHELEPRMENAACLMPGVIALSASSGLTVAEARKTGKWGPKQEGELHLARELTKTCWGLARVMSTALAPEAAVFDVDDPPLRERDGPLTSKAIDWTASDADWRTDYHVREKDAASRQRPETVATLFYMYRITGDLLYREWGWALFRAWVSNGLLSQGGGFAAVRRTDRTPVVLEDRMESWWMGATLKYFYLLFGPDNILPLEKTVFSSAGHPLPIFKLQRGLKTGWERKKRDKDGKILDSERRRGNVRVLRVEDNEAPKATKRAEAAPATTTVTASAAPSKAPTGKTHHTGGDHAEELRSTKGKGKVPGTSDDMPRPRKDKEEATEPAPRSATQSGISG